jgi:hypothetical protein
VGAFDEKKQKSKISCKCTFNVSFAVLFFVLGIFIGICKVSGIQSRSKV